jgi:hemolysin D
MRRGLELRQTSGALGPDRDFKIGILAISEAPPSPIRHALMLTVCLLVAVAVALACCGRVDIYSMAVGRIEPAGRSRVVQPVEAGRVVALHVHNGSHVRTGDVLVEIDPTAANADRRIEEQKVSEFDAELARREAAIGAILGGRIARDPPIRFPSSVDEAAKVRETDVLASDLAKLRGDVAELDTKITEGSAQRDSVVKDLAAKRTLQMTLTQKYELRKSLADKHWETEATVLDALTDLQRTNEEIAEDEGKRHETEVSIAAAAQARNSALSHFVAENSEQLEQVERKRRESAGDLQKASVKLDETRLVAPINGIVQALDVTTIGQVVTSAQQLMVVVPDDEALAVEALVTNSDIGFIEPGQDAVIKVDAYPYSRYGTLPASVLQVPRESVLARDVPGLGSGDETGAGADSEMAKAIPELQNLVFLVKLKLLASSLEVDGRAIVLTPGLTCQVEIKTGQRRLISFITSPLIESISAAGHER